jgi:hypothetical protein
MNRGHDLVRKRSVGTADEDHGHPGGNADPVEHLADHFARRRRGHRMSRHGGRECMVRPHDRDPTGPTGGRSVHGFGEETGPSSLTVTR